MAVSLCSVSRAPGTSRRLLTGRYLVRARVWVRVWVKVRGWVRARVRARVRLRGRVRVKVSGLYPWRTRLTLTLTLRRGGTRGGRGSVARAAAWPPTIVGRGEDHLAPHAARRADCLPHLGAPRA